MKTAQPRVGNDRTRTAAAGSARLALAAAALTLACGCSNPLASKRSDYGVRVDQDRLRAVQPLDLDEHLVGEERVEAPVDPAADPFRNLERIELSLEECRAASLANNLDLKVALVSPEIANERLSAEEAAFESLIYTNVNVRDTDTATASELDSAQARFQALDMGVRIPLRTGGTATVSLPISRSETNNQFSTLNPSWTTDLRFSIAQPLLRNAGRRVNTYGIRVAWYSAQITEAQAKLQVINQIAEVDRAYWRLYQAQSELEVRQRQYELAVEQLERAQRQVDVGRVAEIEVVRAQAGVAERLDAIIRVYNLVRSQQRRLKRAINMPGLGVETETYVALMTEPDPVRYELEADPLADSAVAERMEMLELELRLATDDSTIELRRNQMLPRFDLNASYQINGLGGTLSEASSVLKDNNFEDWSVGFNLEVPVGNEAARSRLREAILSRLQRIATKESREQTIRQEVHDAVDNLQSAWQRVMAAQQSTILNTRALEAEQRQFSVGSATSTDVLDQLARLADARSQEIRAIVDYQISQTDLAAATGTLLGATRVRWDPLDPSDGDGD
jgi:outer membrane protein